MKTIKKALAGLLSVAALMTGATPIASAEGDIRVVVNGAYLDFEGVSPQIIGTGTTMVPFRDIFEALGMTVSYRHATDFFRIWAIDPKNDKRIDMFIDENEMFVSKPSIFDSVISDTQLLDPAFATRYELEEAPFINENGSTLVPARAIAEALGATVSWNQETSTVFVDYGLVPSFKDNKNGDYPGTDMSSFFSVTGIGSDVVTKKKKTVKYEYTYSGDAVDRYLKALEEEGTLIISQGGGKYVLESPTNRYIGMEVVSDKIVTVAVMSDPDIYIMGFDEEVPNYRYYTGRECESWKDYGAEHLYFYGRSEEELQRYISVLKENGYWQTSKTVNPETGAIKYLYTTKSNCVQIIDLGTWLVGISVGSI